MGFLSSGSSDKTTVSAAQSNDSKSDFIAAWSDNFAPSEGATEVSKEELKFDDKDFFLEGAKIIFETVSNAVEFVQDLDAAIKEITRNPLEDAFDDLKSEIATSVKDFLGIERLSDEEKDSIQNGLETYYSKEELQDFYEMYETNSEGALSFQEYMKEDVSERKFEADMEKYFTEEEREEMKEEYEDSLKSYFMDFEDFVKDDLKEAKFEEQLEKNFTSEEIADFKNEYENSWSSLFSDFSDYMDEELAEKKFESTLEKYFSSDEIESFESDYNESDSPLTFEEYMESRIDNAKEEAKIESFNDKLESLFDSDQIEDFANAYKEEGFSEFMSFESFMKPEIEEAFMAEYLETLKIDAADDSGVQEAKEVETLEHEPDMTMMEHLQEGIEEIKFEEVLERSFTPEEIHDLKADYEENFSESISFMEYMQEPLENQKDISSESIPDRPMMNDEQNQEQSSLAESLDTNTDEQSTKLEGNKEVEEEVDKGENNDIGNDSPKYEEEPIAALNEAVQESYSDTHNDRDIESQDFTTTNLGMDDLNHDMFESFLVNTFSESEIDELHIAFESYDGDMNFQEYVMDRINDENDY